MIIPEDWARQCNMGAARGLSMSDRLVCRYRWLLLHLPSRYGLEHCRVRLHRLEASDLLGLASGQSWIPIYRTRCLPPLSILCAEGGLFPSGAACVCFTDVERSRSRMLAGLMDRCLHKYGAINALGSAISPASSYISSRLYLDDAIGNWAI